MTRRRSDRVPAAFINIAEARKPARFGDSLPGFWPPWNSECGQHTLLLSIIVCRRCRTKPAPRRRRCSQPLRKVSKAGNLTLAARRRVGHIGLTGDVAEWLKAAVC